MASRNILEFLNPRRIPATIVGSKSVPATVAELVENEIKKTSEDLQKTATDAIVT